MTESTSQPSPSPAGSADSAGSSGKVTRSAATAVLWLGSTTVLWQVVSWATTLLTARILDPTDYGLIAMAETVLPYLALVGAFSLGTWMVQVDRLEEPERRAMLSLTLVSSVVMTILAVTAAPLIAHFYENDALIRPFQWMSTLFVFRGIATLPQASLERDIHFRPIAIMNLVLGVSRGLLQLGLAYLGYGYWALVIGIVAFEATRCVWLVSIAGLPKGLGWDPALYGRAIRFGGATTGGALLWILFSSADDVVVGKLFSVEMLGFYSMAFFLTDLPMAKINQVVRPVLLPMFSRLREQGGAVDETFLRVIRGICSVSFPALAGLFVVAEEAVAVVLGEKWAPLVTPLQVLCFVGWLRALTTNIEPLLQAFGQPQKILVFNAIRAFTMPPAFVWLGREYGIEGIYAAWLLLFPWTSFYILFALKRVVGLGPARYLLNLKAPIVASFGMAAGTVAAFGALESHGLAPGAIAGLAAKIVFGGALYLGLLWGVFRRDFEDILESLRELRG